MLSQFHCFDKRKVAWIWYLEMREVLMQPGSIATTFLEFHVAATRAGIISSREWLIVADGLLLYC